jgi:hypothetical protein
MPLIDTRLLRVGIAQQFADSEEPLDMFVDGGLSE